MPPLPKATAFLAVFSSPGQSVSLEEFHDWYNNEHIPLRLNHLPSFLTGARYASSLSSHHRSTSSRTPGWLAVYDVTSTSTFSDPSYTRLRAHRSPREKDLVNRLALLDRRTCVVVKDTANDAAKEGQRPSTTGFALNNPTQWVHTHGMNVVAPDDEKQEEGTGDGLEDEDDEEKVNIAWSVLVEAARGQGWIRTRLFRCIDSLRTGTSVSPTDPSQQIVPRYLVVHEMEQKDDIDALEKRLARLALESPTKTPNMKFVIDENNTWELYRAYPSLAQGTL